eukprot:749492-Hanusia_phi.AAC.4
MMQCLPGVRKDLVEKNKMVLNADSRSHDSKTDVFDNVQVVSTCLRYPPPVAIGCLVTIVKMLGDREKA